MIQVWVLSFRLLRARALSLCLRDLQKRPSTVSKETQYSVKRDLVQCQKRPSTVSKETQTFARGSCARARFLSLEANSVKRDLLQCQKRPTLLRALSLCLRKLHTHTLTQQGDMCIHTHTLSLSLYLSISHTHVHTHTHTHTHTLLLTHATKSRHRTQI